MEQINELFRFQFLMKINGIKLNFSGMTTTGIVAKKHWVRSRKKSSGENDVSLMCFSAYIIHETEKKEKNWDILSLVIVKLCLLRIHSFAGDEYANIYAKKIHGSDRAQRLLSKNQFRSSRLWHLIDGSARRQTDNISVSVSGGSSRDCMALFEAGDNSIRKWKENTKIQTSRRANEPLSFIRIAFMFFDVRSSLSGRFCECLFLLTFRITTRA